MNNSNVFTSDELMKAMDILSPIWEKMNYIKPQLHLEISPMLFSGRSYHVAEVRTLGTWGGKAWEDARMVYQARGATPREALAMLVSAYQAIRFGYDPSDLGA